MQRTHIGKYSFVNSIIQHWKLCVEVIGTLHCKTYIFKKRVRRVIIEVSERKVKCAGNHLKVQRSEIKME